MQPTMWHVIGDDDKVVPGRTVTLLDYDTTTGYLLIINEHGRAELVPFLTFSTKHVHVEYRRPIL